MNSMSKTEKLQAFRDAHLQAIKPTDSRQIAIQQAEWHVEAIEWYKEKIGLGPRRMHNDEE